MPKYETELIIFRVNENYERHAQNFNYLHRSLNRGK